MHVRMTTLFPSPPSLSLPTPTSYFMKLLMRFVDDFLLITHEEELARDFVTAMNAGVPSYNCTVNNDKGGANFKLAGSGEVLLDKDGNSKVFVFFKFLYCSKS